MKKTEKIYELIVTIIPPSVLERIPAIFLFFFKNTTTKIWQPEKKDG